MNKRLKIISSVVILIFAGYSCEYEKIKPSEAPAIVSFSKDVAPIFSNNCISCHSSGGTPPDLSSENLYLSLSAYVDTITPESSELYLIMTNKSKPMPPSGVLADYDLKVILTWMKTGAKEN